MGNIKFFRLNIIIPDQMQGSAPDLKNPRQTPNEQSPERSSSRHKKKDISHA
jgi:hypothetical protein